ncbi:MAG: insulinase family protein [Acidobacteriota bacterium]|nr:insulinase family protein [Acidobacteriota bacterium]
MRSFAAFLAIPLLTLLPLRAQLPSASEVQERRLPNGIRLLLVERPGLPAFHATLAFRGGWAEEPASLPGATELLAHALYGAAWPEDVGEPSSGTQALEALLKQEDGLAESLRLARLVPDGGGAAQATELEASLQTLQARVAALRDTTPLADLYARLGGHQSASAEADALLVDTELPVTGFDLWCHAETTRLERLEMSRFFEARTALLDRLRTRQDPGPALLRGAAFPGHPYGRNLADHRAGIEALRWSDLRDYAARACSPERLTIILVGGVSLDTALPLLSRTLGALPTPALREEPIFPDLPKDLGDRQIQATLGAASRLLVGWRIPPRNQPDHLALAMAARLLGGERTGRLTLQLVDRKRLAQRVVVRLDQPGGRHGGLLTVEMQPAEGHSLPELEAALHSEILRFQQEAIAPEAWQRALAELDLDHLQAEDAPGRLARALGLAWTEAGDWHAFYTEPQRLEQLTPEAVQSAVQTWLTPSHRTTALIEPALQEQDPLDVETVRTLRALAARRIEDPGQRERLVAEGLRQLRMLPPEERRRTLKLLLAQLPPERP